MSAETPSTEEVVALVEELHVPFAADELAALMWSQFVSAPITKWADLSDRFKDEWRDLADDVSDKYRPLLRTAASAIERLQARVLEMEERLIDFEIAERSGSGS
jgi:hypothetical protein